MFRLGYFGNLKVFVSTSATIAKAQNVMHNNKPKELLIDMKDKFHLKIPKESVRMEKFEKNSGGTSYKRTNHTEHGFKLRQSISKIREIELNKKDINYTSEIYFKVQSPDNRSIKSEKLNLENLGINLITLSKKSKNSAIGKLNIDKINSLEERLENYIHSSDNKGKSYFSGIEDFSPIEIEEKIEKEIDLDINAKHDVVINFYKNVLNENIFKISNLIKDELNNSIENFNLKTFENGITSISCRIYSYEIKSLLQKFNSIKEVKRNFTTIVQNSFPVNTLPKALNIKPAISDSMICVIDSGISKNHIFQNLVNYQYNYTPLGSVSPTFSHGTFVASRATFGDLIDECLSTNTLQPYCKFIDVQIFGKDANGNELNPSEFHVRTVIETIVKRHYMECKVYNLSLGADDPISDYTFSEMSKLIDYLSKQYKVLFIISSGNIDNSLGNYPLDHFTNSGSRITPPAESLLGLTVGSIAKHDTVNSLSKKDELSPFSRIGPGSDYGIKPELVAHGGNLVSPYNFNPRVSSYGFSPCGMQINGNIGTSFSAPIVALYAQKLFDYYPDATHNLIKALLCHFAISRNLTNDFSSNIKQYIGFGEPDIESASVSKEFNGAFIYEGELDDSHYQYVGFHIPSTLSENSEGSLKVKITIVYDPQVDPDNEVEYSQARISASLFKNTSNGRKEINIDTDSKYNLPWNPIIQFEKSFKRSYLTGEWFLRLRLYTRGNSIDENYRQNYAVVIEIIDEDKNIKVYDDILAQFNGIYQKVIIKLAA